MTTTLDRTNPDGGDAQRDEADPLGPQERVVLQAFFDCCEHNDYLWCYATKAFEGIPIADKQCRKVMKGLRAKGLLQIHRGGTDEDGQIVGGSGYSVTPEGKRALAWTAQRELKL